MNDQQSSTTPARLAAAIPRLLDASEHAATRGLRGITKRNAAHVTGYRATATIPDAEPGDLICRVVRGHIVAADRPAAFARDRRAAVYLARKAGYR